MDPSFQGPRGYLELDSIEDRMDEEQTPSGSGNGRRRGIPVSPTAGHRRRRSRRRAHNPQPIDLGAHALRPDEYRTNVTFLTWTGNQVRFPNVLVSGHWPQGAIAGRLSNALGYRRINLPPSRIRRFITPRGSIVSTQAAVACFRLDSRPDQVVVVMLLVLEDQPYGHFNVSMIVGRSLRRCLNGQEWPLSQNIPFRAIHTFTEVIDYPRVVPCHMWNESTRNDIVNSWLANSVRIPDGEDG